MRSWRRWSRRGRRCGGRRRGGWGRWGGRGGGRRGGGGPRAGGGTRGAAAVALGQMGETAAVKPLVALTKDADWYVRGMAWLGVGLAGNSEAERELSKAAPATEFEQMGVVAGMAMLDKPGEVTFG